MGFWSSLLKTGGKAVKYGGKATVATGKSVGNAVLHPSQTLRGAGSALKTATVGGAVGYVGWEKLTTDKSVVRIVSDAVIGEKASEGISNAVDTAAETVSRITDKAEQTLDGVSQASSSFSSTLDGASNFLGSVSSGNGGNMLGNFFCNLANGKVSGLSIAGLIAGAFLVFGRTGWLGKIAGAFLMMMTIGNHANLLQESTVANAPRQTPSQQEEQSHSSGMRR
ncbi:hypothetical protein [Phocaeicola vulgatus]|uniref:hypothetical protein n=1 Tax=Phocaeicola vulgatus TaxID=821 RepID=UPI0035630CA0